MDEVPQRRPVPPRSSSCSAKLPPIWGVLWVFFLLLQPTRRPRLRRRSRRPPPWCGAAAAEVSETKPGLEQVQLEAKAMAIATSVSLARRGGCGAETLTAALHSCHFYFCLLFVSLFRPFLLQEAVSLSSLLFPFLLPSSSWVWVPLPSLLPILFFFLEAAPGWRGGGKSSLSPICFFMGGTDGPWWMAGACDWEASKRLGEG